MSFFRSEENVTDNQGTPVVSTGVASLLTPVVLRNKTHQPREHRDCEYSVDHHQGTGATY